MENNIIVPKKINVSYRNKVGTYSGKFAYITYFDEKGKLREEKSWENWGNKDIPTDIFNNEPLEGFVLNKKVSVIEKTCYDCYKNYVGVYDPRGFEFEITIPNLLWILGNCTSTKDKGLEGQFVYGWDRKGLVLVPLDSPDYKEIIHKSEIIYNDTFVKAQDLIVGATYKTLYSNDSYVYMGKFEKWVSEINYNMHVWNTGHLISGGWMYPLDKTWKDNKVIGGKNRRYQSVKKGEYFFFVCLKKSNIEDEEDRQIVQTFETVTRKFSECINEKCHNNYSEFVELLEHDMSYSGIDYSNSKIFDLPYNCFYGVVKNIIENPCLDHDYLIKAVDREGYLKNVLLYINLENGQIYIDDIPCMGFGIDSIKKLYKILKPVYGEVYLKNGNLFKRVGYYDPEE